MAGDWQLAQRFDFEGRAVAHDVMGDGPPLVLVHGTPFSAFVWRAIAPILAERHRVHLFDLLGYGQSDRGPGDVSLGIQNRLLAALLAYWRLDRPDVIAHDFGGATALRAHLLDGCDYRRLLLVDPVALSPWGSPFVQHVRRHEAAFSGVPDDIQRGILGAYIAGAAHRPLGASALEGYAAPWLGATGRAAFYRQIAQMDRRFTDAIEDRLGEMRCASRLIWGAEDRWIPVEQGREVARRLPGCRLVEISACGHLVQEDAPEAIIAVARDFLAPD